MVLAKKSLSQNFLNDKNICKKIINQTNIKNRIVVEIGPGYGFMTDFILEKKPKKLILIEKDSNLSSILKEKFEKNFNVLVIEKDVLKFNFEEYKNIIIISNLPYNISTKIILYLLKFNKNINEMILMIQKEVASKFNYNISNMNKYKFYTKITSEYLICFNVSPKVFFPQPKINSSVVKFILNKNKLDWYKAYKFSSLIFKNVRKKINNNLKINSEEKLLDKRVNELKISELLKIYNLF